MFKKVTSKLKIIFTPCQKNNYRPKFLASRFLFYFFIVLILLKLVFVSFLFYFPKTLFFAEISRSCLIELTNKERENLDINPLRENPQLDKAALLKAQDMMNQNYFSHQSPAGTTPWHWFQKANYDYEMAGENLGIGFLDSEEIHQAWNNSPSHKANLLNPNYQDIGIAVLKGEFEESETTVVVQLFGSPLIQEVLREPSEILNGIEAEEEIAEEAEQEQETASEEKVVSEEVASAEVKESQVESSATTNFFRFMVKDYNDLVQKIIFFSLALIVISLMINILIKFDVQHKDLIWKAVFVVAILGLFVFMNKEFIIQIIPHSLNIY